MDATLKIEKFPMDDIASCVGQLINIAASNGANSVSMPDEYVSVAHFVSFPQEYEPHASAEIERLEARIRELEGKMDIIKRYTEGEGIMDGDHAMLANDYGGTGWEKDPVLQAVATRMQKLRDWDENMKYLLDSFKGSIRCRYKNTAENYLESMCVTFIALREYASIKKGDLAYLAIPYFNIDPKIMERRFNVVNRVAGRLIKGGKVVFSPISQGHPIAAVANLPKDWAFWENICRVSLSHCSELIVVRMDGWEESRGVTAEIEIANQMEIPIRYIDPTPEDLQHE